MPNGFTLMVVARQAPEKRRSLETDRGGISGSFCGSGGKGPA